MKDKHENEQLRCKRCGLITDWFHGWSFTIGRTGLCRPGMLMAGNHLWTLEPKE